MLGEAFEVLDGSDQQEFVPGAREPTQSEPDAREDVFDLAEERLDLLSLGAGGSIGLGLHQRLGIVPCVLVHVTRDPALRCFGATARLQRAHFAVALASSIVNRPAPMNPPSRLEDLAAGADIEIAVLIVGEVRPREGAVIALALVPDRDMRINFAINQPTE